MEQQLIFDQKPIIGLEHVLLGLGELTDRLQNQGGLTHQIALESEFIMGSRDLMTAYQSSDKVVQRYNLAMENIFQKAKDVVVTAVKKMVEFLKKLWYMLFEPKFMKIRRLKKHLETFDDIDDVLNSLRVGDIDNMLTVALKQGGEFKKFVDSMSPLQLAIIGDNTPQLVSFKSKSKSLDQQIVDSITHDKIAKVLNGGLSSLEAFRDKWSSTMSKIDSGATQAFSKKTELHEAISSDFVKWTQQSTDTIDFAGGGLGVSFKVKMHWTDVVEEVMRDFKVAEQDVTKNTDKMRQALYSESTLVNLTSTDRTLLKMIGSLKIWNDDRLVKFYTTETERIMKDLDGFIKHMEKLERNPSGGNQPSSSKQLTTTHVQFDTTTQHTFLDTKFIEGLRILTKACNEIGSIFAYVEKKIALGVNGLKKVYTLYADLFAKVMKLDVYSRISDREQIEKVITKYRGLAAQL